MKTVPKCTKLPGSACCGYRNLIRQISLAIITLLWVSLHSSQQLAAQCGAGSFVPPSLFSTVPTGALLTLIWAFEQEPNGKFIVVGSFSGSGVENIARINSDGSVDNSFTPPTFGGYAGSNRLRSVVRLADGKYLVGGYFTTPTKYIARLNSDGTLDNSFTPPSSTFHSNGAYVNIIKPLPNGQYMIGGNFSAPVESIMRLNSDGSLDNSFGYVGEPGPTTPNRIHSSIQDFEILDNGKIVVATGNGVDLLNTDGTRDLTFTNIIFGNPFGGGAIIQSVEVQPDGKILASGSFTTVSNRIVRLNPDGTQDHSFVPPASLTSIVFELELQDDGKIMIGGTFSDRIMRLNADGSRDNTLDVPAISGGLTGSVRDIQLLPSGYYIASGTFTSPRNNIAILCEGGITLSNVATSYCAGQTATVGYNSSDTYTAGNIFTVQLSNASGNFNSPTNIGTLTSAATSGSINVTIPANITYGTGYRMRISSSAPAATGDDNGSDITLGIQQTPTLSTGNPSAACDGTVTITSTGSFSSYAWSTNATTSSATVSANGTYSLTVTDANGCTASAAVNVSSIIPCCTAPAQAGTIAGAQTICPNSAAATLTSNTAASGGVGTLEYRWQKSTTGAGSGFSDIASSNSATYAPGVLSTTTWFRRLGGVSCLTDWSNAPASNVIQVTADDTTPPVVSCLPFSAVFNGQADLMLNVNDLASANDNCGLQSVVMSQPSINCAQSGQTVAVTVTATDNSGNTASCVSQVTVGGLPCGWRQQPNGVNCSNGNSVTFNTGNQAFTLNSTNCHTPMAPHTVDGFAFAQRTLCGDGSLQAEMISIDGLGWGGIAMRESNAPGSKKVHLLSNGKTQHRREVRSANDAQASPQVWLGSQRYWLRLTRTGNDFVGQISSNGSQWVQAMSARVTMNSCIEIGLITHHSNSTGNMTTVFANVSVTGNSSNPMMQSNTQGDAAAEQVLTNYSSIFPNPTNGQVIVDLESYLGERVTLQLTDLYGRQLESISADEVGTPLLDMDLSNYPAGIYLLQIKAEGKAVRTERIIRQ